MPEISLFFGIRVTMFYSDHNPTRLTVPHDTVAWDIDGTRDPRTCVDLDPWREKCRMLELFQNMLRTYIGIPGHCGVATPQ